MTNKKEFDKGYSDAVETIKKILGGQSQHSSNNNPNNNQQTSQDGRDMDLGGTPAGDVLQKTQNNSNLSNNSGSNQQSQNGQNSSDSNSRGGGEQGVVRPEDCAGQFGNNMPDTPGGFTDTQEGNKLAEEEGYDKGPTDDAVAQGWKEAAINAAQKARGSKAGSLISKILDIWKTTTDWKKAFRKIVGRSLNTRDMRSAYANKNVLATRDMIARTDKDKYDVVDYMCIFTDSSGSISDDNLRYMLSEIYNIAYSMKPETLIVGQFDTKITDIQIFHNPQEFKKYTKNATVKGRGGTDCECIWKLLKTDKRFARNSAELVIIMTDGDLKQIKRDSKTMNNLCWVILDNANWDVEYNDSRTMCVHLKSEDIKK